MTAVEEPAWDVTAAISPCKILPWSDVVWRSHSARWPAENTDGSLRVSGRFNRGLAIHDRHDAWPVLSMSLSKAIALGVRVRHTSPGALSHLFRLLHQPIAGRSLHGASGMHSGWVSRCRHAWVGRRNAVRRGLRSNPDVRLVCSGDC